MLQLQKWTKLITNIFFLIFYFKIIQNLSFFLFIGYSKQKLKRRKTAAYDKIPPAPNVCYCCVQLLGLETCKLGNACYQIHSVSKILSEQYQSIAVPSDTDNLRIRACGLKLASCQSSCIPDHIPLSVYIEEDVINIQKHLKQPTKRPSPVSRSYILKKRRALLSHSKDPKLCETTMLPVVIEQPEGEEVPSFVDDLL